MKKGIYFFIVLVLIGIGCKDPYHIKVPPTQQSQLVVEGFLDAGTGPTTITLSRTFGLSDTSTRTMETGASVMIEGQRGITYQLGEVNSGMYSATLGALDTSQQYRLHIRTTGGREYASDYVHVQSTPPIDSVNWTRDNNGVNIYVNTHDPKNNSKYYRWEYVETWEIHPPFIARYKYDPNAAGSNYVVGIPPDQVAGQCWKTVPSSSLVLATSTGLKSDVIYQKALLSIPEGDEKLSVRYSILAKQYVLSQQAYDFFQLMKKNTESLGSIFDPLPSEITGNIHSLTNNAEPVIGIFYASSGQQMRIFINSADVPNWHHDNSCEYIKIPPNKDSVKAAVSAGLYPYDADVAGIVILDYRIAAPPCYDCTFSGGSTAKPSFW